MRTLLAGVLVAAIAGVACATEIDDQSVYIGTTAVMAVAPPRAFVFNGEDGEVGKLDWSSGRMQFTGDADASARVFFESFQTIWDAYVRFRVDESCREPAPSLVPKGQD